VETARGKESKLLGKEPQHELKKKGGKKSNENEVSNFRRLQTLSIKTKLFPCKQLSSSSSAAAAAAERSVYSEMEKRHCSLKRLLPFSACTCIEVAAILSFRENRRKRQRRS
jgi:hypothetical protein